MDKYFNSVSPFPIFVVYQAYNCHLMKYAKIYLTLEPENLSKCVRSI